MIVWFIALFTIGIWRITFCPSILLAFNPWEAISYLIREKTQGFIQMGTFRRALLAPRSSLLF